MTEKELQEITKTETGIQVKNLRWLKVDNIIVGLVQCPMFGNPNINEGFIGGQWKKNGIPTNRIKGREELKLPINLENSK